MWKGALTYRLRWWSRFGLPFPNTVFAQVRYAKEQDKAVAPEKVDAAVVNQDPHLGVVTNKKRLSGAKIRGDSGGAA